MSLRIGSLFSGYGGLDLAATAVFGGQVAWHADHDPAAAKVLAHHWPQTPNHGDITAVDWAEVEPVEVLTGGFPCQDLSAAGRRSGLRPGTRSGLWAHMAHAIATLRPDYVVVENVRGLLHAPATAPGQLEPCPWCLGDRRDQPLRALGAVLGDLAQLGYDTRWCGLRAADIGAPHGRYRIFLVATAVPDPHSAAGGQRGITAPGQAQSRRSRADLGRRSRTPAAHPHRTGRQGPQPARRHLVPARSARDWGAYTGAIHRWEHILGCPAPEPTEPGRHGNPVLNPAFVEWLMGLPTGHVTAVPGLSRNARLRLLGNGVVPQQATAALEHLLDGAAAGGLPNAA